MSADSPADDTGKNSRPRRYLSDSFYLVLAAAGLLQVPRTVEVSGWFTGICFIGMIVMFTGSIALSNKGRFRPMFNKSRNGTEDSCS